MGDSSPTARDTITGFVQGQDKFDFSAIDANTSNRARGDQAFVFGGKNSGVVANSVTWFEDTAAGNTVVQADVDGNTTADISIVLIGLNLQLGQSDFIL